MLGHRITPEGIFPDESKFDSIKNFPQPKCRKDVRRFLGLTGYYRKFIKDYGIIAKPLTALTSINKKFEWTQQHQIAFDVLKEKLINPPVLAYPDFNLPFRLNCDASGTGISGVLSQVQEGKERQIAYGSRALTERERIASLYSSTEKELLAIVWTVKHFRQYLYGKPFEVFTDNKALIHLNSMANENSRIMKYKFDLREVKMTVNVFSTFRQVLLSSSGDSKS